MVWVETFDNFSITPQINVHLGTSLGHMLCAGTGTLMGQVHSHILSSLAWGQADQGILSPVQVTSPQHIDTWISRIISFLLLTDLINWYPTVYSVQLKHFRSLDYKGHSQQYVRDISWYISVFLLLIYNCHCVVHFLMTSCKTKCVFFGAFLLDVVLTDSEDYYVLRPCFNYTFHRNKQNNNPFIIKYEKSQMTWSNSFFENTHIWCYDVFDIGFTLTCISLSYFSIFFFYFSTSTRINHRSQALKKLSGKLHKKVYSSWSGKCLL